MSFVIIFQIKISHPEKYCKKMKNPAQNRLFFEHSTIICDDCTNEMRAFFHSNEAGKIYIHALVRTFLCPLWSFSELNPRPEGLASRENAYHLRKTLYGTRFFELKKAGSCRGKTYQREGPPMVRAFWSWKMQDAVGKMRNICELIPPGTRSLSNGTHFFSDVLHKN